MSPVLRNRSRGHAIVAGLALSLLASCGSTRSQLVNDSLAVNDVWVQPSPILQQQLADEAQRLPWTRGFERLEQIRWFASVGEPAYETLLRLAEERRDHVAAAALAALGATLDRRLVSHIRLLEWSEERDQTDLGLERARALVRLGDWSKIPLLISGLRDGRVYTRALCLDALREATHETHGFDPRSDAGPRKKAIERWESWWNDRARDEFLHG